MEGARGEYNDGAGYSTAKEAGELGINVSKEHGPLKIELWQSFI